MTRLTIIAAIGVLSATNPLPATAGSEPAGHSHDMENFSAGEPGDPEKSYRVATRLPPHKESGLTMSSVATPTDLKAVVAERGADFPENNSPASAPDSFSARLTRVDDEDVVHGLIIEFAGSAGRAHWVEDCSVKSSPSRITVTTHLTRDAMGVIVLFRKSAPS